MGSSTLEMAWRNYRQLADQPDHFTRWMLARSVQVLEAALAGGPKTAEVQQQLTTAHAALLATLAETPLTPPAPVDRRLDLLRLELDQEQARQLIELFQGDLSHVPLDELQSQRTNPWGGFRAAWLEHYNHVLGLEK